MMQGLTVTPAAPAPNNTHTREDQGPRLGSAAVECVVGVAYTSLSLVMVTFACSSSSSRVLTAPKSSSTFFLSPSASASAAAVLARAPSVSSLALVASSASLAALARRLVSVASRSAMRWSLAWSLACLA